MAFLIIIVLAALIVIYNINIYNKMVRNRNLVQEAWSTIDVFLKNASSNFITLQNQLASLEDDLEKSCRYYNETVRENNITIENFPSNIIAGIGHFEKRPFFETDEASKVKPVVNF